MFQVVIQVQFLNGTLYKICIKSLHDSETELDLLDKNKYSEVYSKDHISSMAYVYVKTYTISSSIDELGSKLYFVLWYNEILYKDKHIIILQENRKNELHIIADFRKNKNKFDNTKYLYNGCFKFPSYSNRVDDNSKIKKYINLPYLRNLHRMTKDNKRLIKNITSDYDKNSNFDVLNKEFYMSLSRDMYNHRSVFIGVPHADYQILLRIDDIHEIRYRSRTNFYLKKICNTSNFIIDYFNRHYMSYIYNSLTEYENYIRETYFENDNNIYHKSDDDNDFLTLTAKDIISDKPNDVNYIDFLVKLYDKIHRFLNSKLEDYDLNWLFGVLRSNYRNFFFYLVLLKDKDVNWTGYDITNVVNFDDIYVIDYFYHYKTNIDKFNEMISNSSDLELLLEDASYEMVEFIMNGLDYYDTISYDYFFIMVRYDRVEMFDYMFHIDPNHYIDLLNMTQLCDLSYDIEIMKYIKNNNIILANNTYRDIYYKAFKNNQVEVLDIIESVFHTHFSPTLKQMYKLISNGHTEMLKKYIIDLDEINKEDIIRSMRMEGFYLTTVQNYYFVNREVKMVLTHSRETSYIEVNYKKHFPYSDDSRCQNDLDMKSTRKLTLDVIFDSLTKSMIDMNVDTLSYFLDDLGLYLYCDFDFLKKLLNSQDYDIVEYVIRHHSLLNYLKLYNNDNVLHIENSESFGSNNDHRKIYNLLLTVFNQILYL